MRPCPQRPLCQHHQGRLAALAPHNAVHFPVSENVPAVDLLRALFGGITLGRSGPVVVARFPSLTPPLPLIQQVRLCHIQENVPPINPVVKGGFTNFSIKLFPVDLDLCQGRAGGPLFIYDLVLYVLHKSKIFPQLR